MKTFSDKLLTIIICILVLSLGISFIFLPKAEYSESENRYLAKAPSFSISNLVSGDYTEGIKDYLTDHFPMRDFWVSLNTMYEELSGKNKINGIYIGKDGYLIGEYEQPKNTGRIVTTLSKFADKIASSNRGTDVRLMLVPTAVTIYRDKLPVFASPSKQPSQMKIIEDGFDMESINVSERLMNAKDENNLYYLTDHHWTSYGAYLGYESYVESLGITPAPLSYFDKKEVTNDFHGTLSAKVNRFNESGEIITVFSDPDAKLSVHFEDTDVTSDSLFNMDYLNKRDKYSLFLDNLHPLITIDNENSTSDRTLMLIKDSYANCVVPFLVHDFARIYVFDTRYYKDGPSNFYEDHPEISDILILYNMNTIDTDTGIRGIY